MNNCFEKVKNFIKGKMSIYEHTFPGEGEVVCNACGERVKNGTPCQASRYLGEWQVLNDVLNVVIDEEGKCQAKKIN